MENLIKSLEEWRRLRGLTQEDVADKLGVRHGTYSMWVQRERVPTKHWPAVKALTDAIPDDAVDALIEQLELNDVYKSFVREIPDWPEKQRIIVAKIALKAL